MLARAFDRVRQLVEEAAEDERLGRIGNRKIVVEVAVKAGKVADAYVEHRERVE